MANPFALTPVDFLGAQNAWQQDLAKTAGMESQARQGQQSEELNKQKIAQNQQAMQQHAALMQDVAAIPEALPAMERLSRVADAAITRGAFGEAEKILSTLSQLDARAANTELRKDAQDTKEQDAKLKRVGIGQQLMSGVTDAGGYDNAIEQYKTLAGEDEWYKYMKAQPYSPGLVTQAKGFLTKQETAGQADLAKARAEQARAAAERSRVTGAASADLATARAAAVREGKQAATKAGGAKSATNEEKKQVSDILGNEYPDLDLTGLKAAAAEIAGDAKEYMRSKGGSYTDAVKAVKAANPHMFEKTSPTSWYNYEMLSGVKDSKGGTRYKPKGLGSSAITPLPAPADRAFVDGKYYTTPKGAMYRSGGQWFKNASEAVPSDGEEEDN